MTSTEAKAFEESATFDVIIQMRKWDEQAKDPNVQHNELDKYKQLCRAVLEAQHK